MADLPLPAGDGSGGAEPPIFGDRRSRAPRRVAAMVPLLAAVALGFAAPSAWSDVPAALKALASGNHAEAAARLASAAEGGDARAQVLLGQILRNPANPQRDLHAAYRWFARASEQNDADAWFWLGTMHRLGESVARDAQQAVQHWRKGAELGGAAAQAALAQALFTGDGIDKAPDEAVRLARTAAERGVPAAQAILGQAYLRGEGGLPRNLGEYLRWTRRAADRGNRGSMESLAESFHTGTGVPQDFVQAHMWANLAGARGSVRATKLRDELAAKMTPDQIAEAQRAASRWRPAAATQTSSAGAGDQGALRRTGTGSGFVVAAPGYVLTNQHVVENCSEVRAPAHKTGFKVVARDEKHDLALLAGELPEARSARFRTPAPRLGEPVMVAGYPLSDLLASSLNVTSGTVSALAGPRNNTAMFQITAPVQRGNSGGPVLDARGEVVGVVVSKLNALRVAMVTGDVPQNVNFAIDGAVARAFIEAQGIELRDSGVEPEGGAARDAPELARGFTLLLECWR